ncbi:hypothetical protein [Salisediminibacterium beveridgei]|uniref:Uncharacterized protein n=1 Tax=Salisediminibacterium beveridgei TaxID=632773 RepID=A0A1D7QV36_9BACI|nr:hypothetical protein [Salisediminibacterium beveridgei]AOM82861.1 hypothetical protein BBEV_1498 [Salisediminibacterium beveridgei]
MIPYGLILVMLALIISIVLSRVTQKIVLMKKCERLLKQISVQIESIHFSFEEMTYFISLPNRNPEIYDAEAIQYRTHVEYDGLIFPEIRGLMIELNIDGEDHQIAYMSLDLLRIPILERWQYEKRISSQEYHELRAAVLMHSNTSKLFVQEVIRQIQRDDRILFLDEDLVK